MRIDFRRDRLRGDAGAEGPERVVDGIHDDGGRRAGAGFADALGAKLGDRRWRLHVHNVDVGHLGRHRRQVVDQRAVLQLAGVVVEAVLVQRAADALHAAAAHLLVGQLRVDNAAAVFHHPVLQQADEAGVGVDLDVGAVDAVGENVEVVDQAEAAGVRQQWLHAVGQLADLVVADAADLGQRQPLPAVAAIDDHAIDDVERVGLGLQQHAGEFQDFLAQVACCLIHGLAADGGGARGVGAAAERRGVGVTREHPHTVDGNAQRSGSDLAHNGVDALALIGDADRADDSTVRLQPDDARILQGDRRAAGAIVAERAGGCALDEGCDADAAVDALLTQALLLLAQAGVVHAIYERVEAALVREILELDAAGAGCRVAVVGHDVAPTYLDRIDAEPVGGLIDQMLGDAVADRMADGAILRGRHLVLIDHGGARPVVLVPVGTAGDVEHLRGLEHAGARILRIGAGARQHVDVERLDGAGLAHRDTPLHGVFARMDVGHERFQAVGDELDRAAELDGGGGGGQLVTVGVDLEAERAADIGRDDLHVVLGNAERVREHVLEHVRALAAGGDGELARRPGRRRPAAYAAPG